MFNNIIVIRSLQQTVLVVLNGGGVTFSILWFVHRIKGLIVVNGVVEIFALQRIVFDNNYGLDLVELYVLLTF